MPILYPNIDLSTSMSSHPPITISYSPYILLAYLCLFSCFKFTTTLYPCSLCALTVLVGVVALFNADSGVPQLSQSVLWLWNYRLVYTVMLLWLTSLLYLCINILEMSIDLIVLLSLWGWLFGQFEVSDIQSLLLYTWFCYQIVITVSHYVTYICVVIYRRETCWI